MADTTRTARVVELMDREGLAGWMTGPDRERVAAKVAEMAADVDDNTVVMMVVDEAERVGTEIRAAYNRAARAGSRTAKMDAARDADVDEGTVDGYFAAFVARLRAGR